MRRDLGQGHQNESAFEKILVRQIQLGMRERRIAVEKNVDIDEARPPADRRFQAHVDLNRIGRGKDFERPQAGFSYSAGIGEKVLLHITPRRGAVDRRNRCHSDNTALLQQLQRPRDVACLVADIAPEPKAGVSRAGRCPKGQRRTMASKTLKAATCSATS